MEHILDLSEQYANSIIQGPDFQRLLELKSQIQQVLVKKIIAFKTAEAKYLEAKDYGKYHPNLEEYQKKFMETKTALYSDPLVKEYKKLEMKIQDKLNQDINVLKGSVSKTFKLNF
ncbi:MAG: YlbF family regulator [Anaeroplasmataceae bacterium]|nr:YlbF family regulator [Anaeroplasmataceae bacterium]